MLMLRLCSLLIVSSLLLGTTHADTLPGRVVGVSDGDTITILGADRQQHVKDLPLRLVARPGLHHPLGNRFKR
ncbi:hypothetical protein [Accumulibacter sp.]|uniref:hypothetical protein n=1 Tax=Accumulibacter sp. TaxID=2053492 RepID=UPI001A3840FD|nr:hypothetical protein [Accumulibacter sp.]MBL8374917.1 hypothetical protein [Accumulibacter sp.]